MHRDCGHTLPLNVSLLFLYPAVLCSPSTGFQCSNGRCVNATNKCDGLNHCGDGSDEFGCGKECCRLNGFLVTTPSLFPPTLGACNSSSFRCNNGKCVSKQNICNYANNCGDNSDELGCGECVCVCVCVVCGVLVYFILCCLCMPCVVCVLCVSCVCVCVVCVMWCVVVCMCI